MIFYRVFTESKYINPNDHASNKVPDTSGKVALLVDKIKLNWKYKSSCTKLRYETNNIK